MKIVSKSAEQTGEIGQNLAKEIVDLENDGKEAIVIALEGELGAGKTTLTQGFAKGLGIEEKITSPTFVIFKIYSVPKGKHFKKMIHVDCYRLKDYTDLKVIGFNKILEDNANIILIEWSDRVKEILPNKHIKVHIDHIEESVRKILIN